MEEVPFSVFEIAQITYDLHNDFEMNAGNIMTEYEAKFSAKGNPIFKYILQRKSAADTAPASSGQTAQGENA